MERAFELERGIGNSHETSGDANVCKTNLPPQEITVKKSVAPEKLRRSFSSRNSFAKRN
jgi:hypothetical protein